MSAKQRHSPQCKTGNIPPYAPRENVSWSETISARFVPEIKTMGLKSGNKKKWG